MGQHFNIIQIPFEILTNPTTGLALDFHIEIHFELYRENLLHDVVKPMVLERLSEMGIALGTDVIDPVSVICFSHRKSGQRGVWSGVIKLHLLNPEVDDIGMLKGLRPFILKLIWVIVGIS